IIGAIATLTLRPNYKMQTRRFDFRGFILLAPGMAPLTKALDGQKSLGISYISLAHMVPLGVTPINSYSLLNTSTIQQEKSSYFVFGLMREKGGGGGGGGG
ncbi:multidrug transporter subunit MdtD, partial [Enterobacter hormaechei]